MATSTDPRKQLLDDDAFDLVVGRLDTASLNRMAMTSKTICDRVRDFCAVQLKKATGGPPNFTLPPDELPAGAWPTFLNAERPVAMHFDTVADFVGVLKTRVALEKNPLPFGSTLRVHVSATDVVHWDQALPAPKYDESESEWRSRGVRVTVQLFDGAKLENGEGTHTKIGAALKLLAQALSAPSVGAETVTLDWCPFPGMRKGVFHVDLDEFFSNIRAEELYARGSPDEAALGKLAYVGSGQVKAFTHKSPVVFRGTRFAMGHPLAFPCREGARGNVGSILVGSRVTLPNAREIVFTAVTEMAPGSLAKIAESAAATLETLVCKRFSPWGMKMDLVAEALCKAPKLERLCLGFFQTIPDPMAEWESAFRLWAEVAALAPAARLGTVRRLYVSLVDEEWQFSDAHIRAFGASLAEAFPDPAQLELLVVEAPSSIHSSSLHVLARCLAGRAQAVVVHTPANQFYLSSENVFEVDPEARHATDAHGNVVPGVLICA